MIFSIKSLITITTIQLRIFPLPQKDPLHPFTLIPHSYPQPQATNNLLLVSVDLSFLDILYKWNHTVCGLL